jgi:hypothetical protein
MMFQCSLHVFTSRFVFSLSLPVACMDRYLIKLLCWMVYLIFSACLLDRHSYPCCWSRWWL